MMMTRLLFVLTPDGTVLEMDAAGMTLRDMQNARRVLEAWGCRTTSVREYANTWRATARLDAVTLPAGAGVWYGEAL